MGFQRVSSSVVAIIRFALQLLHADMRVGKILLGRVLLWFWVRGREGKASVLSSPEARLKALGIKVKVDFGKGKPLPTVSCKAKGAAMGMLVRCAALKGPDALFQEGMLPAADTHLLQIVFQLSGDYFRMLCNPKQTGVGWAEVWVRGIWVGFAIVTITGGTSPTFHEMAHHGAHRPTTPRKIYRGTSLAVLLQGPMRGLFRMSEVPLYQVLVP